MTVFRLLNLMPLDWLSYLFECSGSCRKVSLSTCLRYRCFLNYLVYFQNVSLFVDIFASHDGRKKSNKAPSISEPGGVCQQHNVPRVSHKALHQRRLPIWSGQACQTLPRKQQNRLVVSQKLDFEKWVVETGSWCYRTRAGLTKELTTKS